MNFCTFNLTNVRSSRLVRKANRTVANLPPSRTPPLQSAPGRTMFDHGSREKDSFVSLGVLSIGQDFVQEFDALFEHFPKNCRTLQQQDDCMAKASCLIPHLQNTAAVRSHDGVMHIVHSGALHRLVSLLKLANQCCSSRSNLVRSIKALAIEGLCSVSTFKEGTKVCSVV